MSLVRHDRHADARIDGLQHWLELIGVEQLVVSADHDLGGRGYARKGSAPVAAELQARRQPERVDRRATVARLGVSGEMNGRQTLEPRQAEALEQRQRDDA